MPRLWEVGLFPPDSELKLDEASGEWRYTEPDWQELRTVVTGHGPKSQERLDFTTPWGKLTLTVLGMLAEIYIDNLRQETRKGKHQRARKGLWNGSIPYGYCRGLCAQCKDPNGAGYCPEFGLPNKTDGSVLIPHPIDSVAVKLAYERYATGDYSDTRVTDALQSYEHHLPDGKVIHFRKRGTKNYTQPGPITKDTVRELLQK